MKKIVVLMAMVLLFALAGTSNASLIAGGGYVHDDVAGIWWYQDLSTFTLGGTGNTYSAQVSYISGMSGGWQLANETQIAGLWSNGGTAIADSFLPSDGSWGYWGRTDIVNGTGHSVGWIGLDGTDHGYNIFQDDGSMGSHIGAWVCTTTNPVPIPSAIWLLGSAFIGLVGCRRKFER